MKAADRLAVSREKKARRLAGQALPLLRRSTGTKAVLLVDDRVVVVPPTNVEIEAAEAFGGRIVGVFGRHVDEGHLSEAILEVASGR